MSESEFQLSDDDQILGTDALTISFLAQSDVDWSQKPCSITNHNPFGTFASQPPLTGAQHVLAERRQHPLSTSPTSRGLSLIGHDFTFPARRIRSAIVLC